MGKELTRRRNAWGKRSRNAWGGKDSRKSSRNAWGGKDTRKRSRNAWGGSNDFTYTQAPNGGLYDPSVPQATGPWASKPGFYTPIEIAGEQDRLAAAAGIGGVGYQMAAKDVLFAHQGKDGIFAIE